MCGSTLDRSLLLACRAPTLLLGLSQALDGDVGTELLVAFFAGFGFSLFAVALMGGLLELISPRHVATRYIFGLTLVAGLGALALALTGAYEDVAVIAGATLCVVWLLVGAPLGILRWRQDWKMVRLWRSLSEDLQRGEVDIFEGDAADVLTEDAEIRATVGALAHDAPVRIEVLPGSSVLLRIGDREAEDFRAVSLVRTAPAGTGYEVRVDIDPSAGLEASSRHMTSAELSELERFRSRMLRRTVLGFLGITYLAAFFLRFGQWLIQWHVDFALSKAGWVLALAVGVLFALWRLIVRYRIGRDVSEHRVLVLREDHPETGVRHALELLPHSRWIWSEDGRAAPWRRVEQ